MQRITRLKKSTLAVLLILCPAIACAEWLTILSEQGRRIEIDQKNSSYSNGEAIAVGRIILDKSVPDPKSLEYYRIIEVENRFDCAKRTYATLSRKYYKEEGDLLREENVKTPSDVTVRSGTPDDRFLREVCRPKDTNVVSNKASKNQLNEVLEKINTTTSDLRRYNEKLVERAIEQDLRHLAIRPIKRATPPSKISKEPAAWSYDDENGPEHWGALSTRYALCASGKQQSPINLKDGIPLDLDSLSFNYPPLPFKVANRGLNLHVSILGGDFRLLGKKYDLKEIVFHHPSEMQIDGQRFPMEMQLIHQTEEGRWAIISVLIEPGTENSAIQNILNHIPLESPGETDVTDRQLTIEALLPEKDRYYTFLGSLTQPPCTENVLWIVLKKPLPLSPAQIAIFQRLHQENARPIQSTFGRLIKESR